MLKRKGNKKSHASLHQLAFILQQASDELLNSRVGIGLAQVRIMGVLNHKLPISQRRIARELHQTEANVSRQLKIMQRQGVVQVNKNPKDSRQRDVTLTSKGVQLYEKAEQVLNDHYLELKGILSGEEGEAFEQATHKLARALHS